MTQHPCLIRCWRIGAPAATNASGNCTECGMPTPTIASNDPWGDLRELAAGLMRERDAAQAEVARLRAERDTPHTSEFLLAVELEALHQRERWAADHDAGKAPEDWFWLLGYLGGKALSAAKYGDREKCLHHLVSSAAVLLNQHAHVVGADTRMRPGIEPPTDRSPTGT